MLVRTWNCLEHQQPVDPKTHVAACGCLIDIHQTVCSGGCGTTKTLEFKGGYIFCPNCVDVYLHMMGGKS